MHHLNNMAHIILASQSPRRKTLLEQAGLRFTIEPSNIDEGQFEGKDPALLSKSIAEAKAESIAARHPNCWIIGADTIVVIDNDVLGKPRNIDDARAMLNQLSGRTHHVMTGYCVCSKGKNRFISDTSITQVQFKQLTPEEIDWYIHTQEPFDKAGAYAIQGIGTFLVRSINGSYTNVVGLPVCEVIEILIKEKVIAYQAKA